VNPPRPAPATSPRTGPHVGAAALPAARGRGRLSEGTSGSRAEVGAELGYFDQSHVIRDFTAAVGMTPVAYMKACAEGAAAIRT
jgi:AraC-like DNA-binding protein